MRRGQYKNVRIWCKIALGMGARKDLYITRMDNEPMSENEIIDLFHDSTEEMFNWRDEYVKPEELIRKENYEF